MNPLSLYGVKGEDMATEDIIWEDPPPPAAGPGRKGYDWFWSALKAHPCKWARYPGSGKSSIGFAARRQGCESVSRTIDGQRVAFCRAPEVS